MGDGGVEGLSATGDGGQSEMSFTPDADDIGPGNLLD